MKWIEIDLDNLIFNVTQLRKKLSSKVKIMAVVKSDAYGHGLIEVAKVLYPKVDSFAVIDLEEALRLVDVKIKKPILILGPIENFQVALDNQFRITAYDIEAIKKLSKIAEKKGKKAIIHVKIDTGMSRVGIYYTQALDFLKDIQNNYSKNIDIEGIYTHLSMADVEDDSFTQIQYNRFIDLINSLQKENISIKLKHIANSAGLLRSSKLWLDMVRLGITLYGVYPAEYLEKEINLLPVLSFKSKIIQIKDIPKGEGISYGRTYITKKQTKVAIIPVGYADGYPRLLSNKAYVLIKSKRAKILGRVTMDFIIADISEIEGVKVGDEVVLIGKQGSQEISAWELAKLAETIPYEIFTNLNKRVRKIYLKGGN